MEGRHDGLLRRPEGQQRDARGDRFVNVEEVELALPEPAAYPSSAERSKVHPRHRAVVADRHSGADAAEFLGVKRRGCRSELARSQHLRPMPGVTQIAGKAENVILHTPWHVEGVRAHESDAQRSALADHRASSAPDRSWGGW